MSLNKPRRIRKGEPSYGKKKFMVKVKNPATGNEKTVKFGDPNMEINPGPKTGARYWSCKFWEKKLSVSKALKGKK
jgi:hypothetical protein